MGPRQRSDLLNAVDLFYLRKAYAEIPVRTQSVQHYDSPLLKYGQTVFSSDLTIDIIPYQNL